MTSQTDHRYDSAAIEADPRVPAIHIHRDFAATPAQVLRAHTDPALVARWMGPDSRGVEIDHWDARDGGSWRYTAPSTDPTSDARPESFRGCFHTIGEDRIVQTFTWEGMPDQVALETLTVEEIEPGRTRLHAVSLCDSFEARDGWLSSGMEVGVDEGYAALDRVLAEQAR